MNKVHFHIDSEDPKVIHRVKKLLSNEDWRLVNKRDGSVISVNVKGSEELQRVRDISKKMPPKVSLQESRTQMLIETKTVEEVIQSLLESKFGLGWSLNTLALELMAGREGDVVIDGKEVWIFSDSREDLRRVMIDIMYDERFNIPFTKDFDIQSKYKNTPEEGSGNPRESHSQKISLGKILSDEDLEFYSSFPSTKNFYFREEYKHWF